MVPRRIKGIGSGLHVLVCIVRSGSSPVTGGSVMGTSLKGITKSLVLLSTVMASSGWCNGLCCVLVCSSTSKVVTAAGRGDNRVVLDISNVFLGK